MIQIDLKQNKKSKKITNKTKKIFIIFIFKINDILPKKKENKGKKQLNKKTM